MRRQSLVAPLLLIGLGTLFLARNLYPDFRLSEYIARYWPMVLIAWGVLRLVEIVYWRATGKSLPQRGVSGGEWLVVVFLTLAGAGLHAARGISTWLPERIPMGGIAIFGEQFDYPVSAEQPASATPHIVIENFRGDLKLTGTDASAVSVTGHKTIHAMNRSKADESDRRSAMEITGDPSHLTLRMPSVPGSFERISAAIEVTVPKGASIEAQGRNGDVHIAGINGAVDLSGRGGDLDLQDINGPVNISGASYGNVQLRNLSQPLHFTSPRTEFSLGKLPGEVHIDLGDFTAADMTGPAHLSVRSQDVTVSDFTNALDITIDRGDLKLSPKLPLARMQATVRSGDIHLALPDGAQFTLNARTRSGQIINDFGAPLSAETDHQRGTLRGAVGNGPTIDLETMRGQIVVTKAVGKTVGKTVLQKLEQ